MICQLNTFICKTDYHKITIIHNKTLCVVIHLINSQVQ